MHSKMTRIVFSGVVVVCAVVLYKVGALAVGDRQPTITRAALMAKINNKEVRKATITNSQAAGELINGDHFIVGLSDPADLQNIGAAMSKSGAEVTFESATTATRVIDFLYSYRANMVLWALSVLTLLAVWLFGIRQRRVRTQ